MPSHTQLPLYELNIILHEYVVLLLFGKCYVSLLADVVVC